MNKLFSLYQRLREKNSVFYLAIYKCKWFESLLYRFYISRYTNRNIANMNQLYRIMADQQSKDILKSLADTRKKWFIQTEYIKSNGEQYFCLEEFGVKPGEDEVFIDGGAYIGDTLQHFIDFVNGKYKHLYCFEPDESNYMKLKELVESNQYKNISLYPKGLWRDCSVLNFAGNQAYCSSIIDTGASTVETVSLDAVIPREEVVSFIKMDIEGSELAALEGASRIIEQDRPKLAISIYHKPEDLWEIPLYLHRNYPFYRFYLRHHSKDSCETVLYAISGK
ncbi:MAG: FkbM family methyltransferase [Firmicutes bacterium]|nr:FkbM family methyltransferase [Bacillota bacterium]